MPIETLLAMILREVNLQVEIFINHIVKDVVISIPTYFNQIEKQAVAEAAKIAGLNLLQVSLYFKKNVVFCIFIILIF